MTTSELEKITINLGLVDLGQIDLLVQEGFYTNRTDFIRTAIRNQLAVHAEATRQTVVRKELVLELQHYTRRDLEAVRACGEMLEIRVLGLASIAGITCEIIGEYHVAIKRVYVAGMSAGGAMAAILGETYPDIYAAVGVHSGLAPGAASDLSSAFTAMRQGGPPAGKSAQTVPAILFHGDRDATVHPRNADHLLAHHSAGDKALQVMTRRGQVSGGYAYTCATHRDAGGRVVVERWTVHGLGHAWSGGR
jgi:Arc/MetJ-type ribon-helix-helix transcriptional regulator